MSDAIDAVAYDASRLDELLHTAAEDVPANFAVDASALRKKMGPWDKLIDWLWLKRDGIRPDNGPRAADPKLERSPRWHRPSLPNKGLPNDEAARPFLKDFWLAASVPRRVPLSVVARRVLLLCCLERQCHLPENVRHLIVQHVV